MRGTRVVWPRLQPTSTGTTFLPQSPSWGLWDEVGRAESPYFLFHVN